MGLPSSKELVFKDVGLAWRELSMSNMPDKFTVVRVQAQIKEGTAQEVALSLRRRPDPTDQSLIALEYQLTDLLDYEERQVVYSHKIKDTDLGKVYIAVRCDTADNLVTVLIEYLPQ